MARIELEVPPDENRGPRWSLLVKVAGAILSVLVVAFLIARITVISPHKSLFTLEDVTLYGFNVSNSPILITSEFQVTSRTAVPDMYEGRESTSIWTMFISGTSVPVAPHVGVALNRDWVINRLVVIMIKLDGQVKWKLGVIAKGSYHITVKCPAYIPFGTNGTGIYVGNNAIKYQLLQRCGVNFSR
ncbi:NDR1/HIN1-like protein 1 [Punica granatum]|uniref:NDR1/HIN1-like protein 1 n=1 Tax=Punica granatum TaxID=22663 RepID=A0A6P8BPD5_PUNGR|nr:NDR1/HIN1-like protein 1 [Punica granatum]